MSGAGRGLGRDRQPPSVRPHPRRHVWEMSPGGCRHRSQGSEVGMCSRHGTARAPLCRQINRVFLLRPRQAEGGFPEQSVGRVSEPTPFPKLLFNTPPTRQVFLRITIIKHSGEPKIPWMEESSRLQSMGSLRVVSLSLFPLMHWRRKWQPTPVFLPGESQGRGSLVAAVYGVAQSWT